MIAKLILLGILTVTAYRLVPEQTKPECVNRSHCTTANGENVSELGVAVSQDFIKSGAIHYGDVLCIDGYGCRIVNDTTNIRHHKCLDLFVYTKNEEHKVGTRHLKVWVLKAKEQIGNEL